MSDLGEHVVMELRLAAHAAVAFIASFAACKGAPDASSNTAPSAEAAPGPAKIAAKPRSALPADPPPPAAELASQVPELEAALAKDAAYQAVFTGPRETLNVFLSVTGEVIANDGAIEAEHSAPLKPKQLDDAVTKLYLVFARIGKLPDEFTTKLAAHLDKTKEEPRLGLWSPFVKGSTVHDYTAIACLVRPEDPAILREHLAARRQGEPGAGPFGGGAWTGKEPPTRPWLIGERSGLARLKLLTALTVEEERRLAKLTDLASQPKLNQDFKLGSFTYNVKAVRSSSKVGTGFAVKRPSDGATFILVEFAIRNDGNETETVLTDDFRLVDAKNREFRPSAEANTALVMSGGKDLGITELQPGLKKSITTGFEVPLDVTQDEFTLVIPEKGALGTGSARITLR